MCGIAGIAGHHAISHSHRVARMVGALSHRGPDDSGIFRSTNCVLGHSRLSIVDLDSGQQPMGSFDGSLSITFNGEIYGYDEIKKTIKDKYPFQTNSDTEVILALFHQYGDLMMEHLPGMFAFAIWDEKKQRLFCGRDRFGEKPFYYGVSEDGCLVFASEIKAILASGLISDKVCRHALGDYLDFGYTQGTRSIYESISRLLPAHTLDWSSEKATINRYWFFPKVRERRNISDATEEFAHLMTESVKRQLVADVDIGCFLSGGIDSNTVCSIASSQKQDLHSLSFGYKGTASELPFAKQSADFFNTSHTAFEEGDISVRDSLKRMPQIFDEPFSDSSAVPMVAICERARRHCKVVLTGDGGDELLGGYTWWYLPHLEYLKLKNASQTSRWFVFLKAIIEKISFNKNRTNRSKWSAWSRNDHELDSVQNFERRRRAISDEVRTRLGLPSFKSPSLSWNLSHDMNDAMRWDTSVYMPDDILVKTDRTSMSVGLELRSPFLDVQVAEFLLSLGPDLKFDSGRDKILLRETFQPQLPAYLANVPKKGFGAPNSNWLNDLAIKRDISDLIFDKKSSLYNVLPYEETALLRKHRKNHMDLLNLSYWCEQERKRFERKAA